MRKTLNAISNNKKSLFSQKALETKRDQLMLELDLVNKAIAEA
uniref:Uncharacterized protein n=1 Tax=Setaria italica TaxID=4555 RepID=K4AKQ6_SETIT